VAKSEPIEVTFDLPADDPTPDKEPTMDDFAKRVTPTAKRRPASKRVTADQEIERLRGELDRNFSVVCIAICMRDAWTGQVILLNKDMVIDGWLEVAKVNPRFRAALLKMMDIGVYATAISNTAALVVAILAHNNLTPNPDFVLTAVSTTGLKMPSDEEVAQMEAMFGVLATDDASVNGSGS
jgi:hypothetical protein